MRDMNHLVGSADILIMTFDTLRYDVAASAHAAGRTPFLTQLLPRGWEARHTPGNFTLAAHAAFFAGFFPTPIDEHSAPRPFALRFPGSRSVSPATCVLEGATIVEGLHAHGYHSICIGGVGFFNKQTPLGRMFPSQFIESYWSPKLGVSHPSSAEHQVELAVQRLEQAPPGPVFLFVNLSALHAPTHFYLPGARTESVQSQAAALEYVDQQLPPLFDALRRRGRPGIAFLMSDHGTAYGEDGYQGHRLSHPVVWTVPYGEYFWEGP